MLKKLFKSEKALGILGFFEKIYSSKYYILFSGLCVILSSLLSIEIPIYALITIVAVVLPALFCDDMKSVIAPLAMFYCSLSLKNNNTFISYSAFNENSFLIPLIVIASIILLFMLVRLVYDIFNHRDRFVKPRLWLGFAILGVVYVLSGIFSGDYSVKSALVGLLEIVSLCATYFYLLVSVDWEKLDKDYVVFTLMVLSFAVIIETLGTYIITKDIPYLIDRDKVTIGWGIHTNMGSMVAIGVATPFYYLLKDEKPLINSFVAAFLMGGTVLTQSRGPIVVSGIIFLFLTIMVFIKGTQRAKNNYKIILFLIILATIIAAIVLRNRIKELFNNLELALNNSNKLRLNTYKAGWAAFTSHPIFGDGWYAAKGQPQFTFVFFPPRWHNTFIQCLATGGVVMLLAYLFHRFQTIQLIFTKDKKIPLNNGIVFVCIISLIAMSLVDCFIFDLGPGLAYGVILAAIERQNKDELNLF